MIINAGREYDDYFEDHPFTVDCSHSPITIGIYVAASIVSPFADPDFAADVWLGSRGAVIGANFWWQEPANIRELWNQYMGDIYMED